MKTSVQITLAVQLGAGLYALHKGDALATFLAFTSASATYFAWQEAQAPATPSDSVLAYVEKIKKGLL